MEPEPEEDEDEQQAAAAAAATEAPDEGTVIAARVDVAGHEIATDTTALHASEWKLTVAQVREVAGALPQLLCLRELVLDGLPVSGATPKHGDFRYGVETVDADLGMFRVLCGVLRACQALTSLSLKKCYLGPQALAVLAEVVFRDASAAVNRLALDSNPIGQASKMSVAPEATVGVAVEKGVFIAVKGRFGEVLEVFRSGAIQVMWLDDGSKSSTSKSDSIKPNQVEVSVAVRSDIIEDYSHLQSFANELSGSKVQQLSLANCNFNPLSLLEFVNSVRWETAVINEVNVSQNPIGVEGGEALANAIPESSLQCIVIGDKSTRIPLHNSEITSLDVSAQEFGPGEVTVVATAISTYAVVKKVALSHNKLFGFINRPGWMDHGNHNVDADQSGWNALCDALPGSPIEELEVADVGMGVTGVTSLAKAISSTAVLTSLTVSQNAIGGPCATSLIDGAKTGVPVQKGVFAAVDGRWGQVRDNPDDDNEVELTWLDTGTNSDYIDAVTLNPVVSSRADLVEDYSHIEQLGQAITRLTYLDVSACKFTPASIKTFTSSVTWETAALVEVITLDSNPIGCPCKVSLKPEATPGPKFAAVDGRFGEVIPWNDLYRKLRWLDNSVVSDIIRVEKLTSTIGSRTDLIEDYSHIRSLGEALSNSKVHTCGLANCNFSPISLDTFVESVTWETAAVKKVVLSQNFLFGSKLKYGNPGDSIHDIDADQSGWSALCGALPSSVIEEFIVADIGMGVTGVTSLAKAISSMAALARVSVLSNPIGADGADALIEVFEHNTNIRTLLGIEEGVTELNLSKKNVDSGQAKILAAELKASRAVAAINEVNVSLNPIGFEGAKALAAVIPKSSLQVIILGTACKIKEGVNIVAATRGAFAIMDGRGGELIRDPDSDREIKLRWLDDGSESSYIKVDRLSSVVSSRADLLFGTQVPVNNSEVTELNFSCQNFGVAEVTVVAAAISTNAVLASLTLDQNGIFGESWIDHPWGDCKEADKYVEESTPLLDAIKMSNLTSLSLSKTGMGPKILSRLATSFSAVLARVNVLSNPIGADGADALIEVFNQNTNLRTLLGIEEGVTEVNLSKKNVDPGQAKILAAELKASRAVAALKKVVLSNNFLFGSNVNDYGHTVHGVDADQSGWSALCDALPGSPVEELYVADVGMGVTGVTSLAKAMSAGAVLKKVAMSNNFLFGSRPKYSNGSGGPVHNIDADQNGWSALCDALPSSPLEELIVADVGMGVTGVTSLAKAISSMAVISSLALGFNRIGDKAMIQLLDVLKDVSLTSLDISKTNCGVSTATKLAELLSKETKFKAALNQLTCDSTGVPARRTGPRTYTLTVGEAAIDLSQKNFGPADVTMLTTWMQRPEVSAVVIEVVNVIGNAIGEPGAKSMIEVFDANPKLQSLVGVKPGSTSADFSRKNMQPHDCIILAHELKASRATAALASLTLSDNRITGTKNEGGEWIYDADLSGFTSLCQVLGKLNEVNLSNCHLGPASMLELAKAFSDADAAVKKVNLSKNFLFGSKLEHNTWGDTIHTVDADQSGWSAVCDALPDSPLEEFIVADIGMGVTGVTSLAKAISSMAAVTALNVISNAIGEPVADLLIDIFQRESRIQTMLGIEDGTTTLDVSRQLDTGCAKLLAAEFTAGRRTRSITKVVLHDNRVLCDAGLAAIWDALPPHVSLAPQFQSCGLTTVPKQLFDKPDTTSIDVSDNDIDHLPWELLTLTNLAELKLEGNERLRTVHDINEQQGVQGVFNYLRDLHREEPTWSYSLKMILAGPSMAGKSSLLNGLVAGKADLTTPDDRTVGLDIKLLRLSDHRRRTHNGLQLQFSCYDAGGHDEYADIHNLFFSLDSLYALLCDLSKPRPDDTGKESKRKETVAKLVQWAASIQAYAPGSVVQLVGSHADEVVARPGVSREQTAQDTCDYYLKCVKEVLREQREEQRHELEALEKSLPRDWRWSPVIGKGSSDHARALHLRKQIDNPLRLADRALSVSAKTLENFDALREALVDAAFNSQAFPEFGTLQPKSYQEIKEYIDVLGTTKPALTWSELRSSLAQTLQKSDDVEPEPEPQHDSEPEPEPQIESEPEPEPEPEAPHNQSGTGDHVTPGADDDQKLGALNQLLAICPADKIPVHLISTPFVVKAGFDLAAKVKRDHHNPPHCVCYNPNTDAPQEQGGGWLNSWLRVCKQTKQTQGTVHVVYNSKKTSKFGDGKYANWFDGQAQGGEVELAETLECTIVWHGYDATDDDVPSVIRSLTRTCSKTELQQAKADAEQFKRQNSGVPQPTQDPQPEPQLGPETKSETQIATQTVTRMPTDLGAPSSLTQALEVDPDLLNRAMLFLRARGAVLYYDHVPALRDRVFIQPQWLVDVIKELVRHDLQEQIGLLDPCFDDVETTRHLAQEFLESGTLQTGLLPWLWRELDPPVGQDLALMTSLMELLVQLGIVIAQPKRAGEPVWLLPMRLPATKPDGVPTLSGEALTCVGRRYDFRVAIPSGLLSNFLGKALSLCGAESTTTSWRHGFTSVQDSEEVSIQMRDTRFIDLRARCVQAGKHSQLLRRLQLFEKTLTTCIARLWKGTSYQVLALGPGDGSVALEECTRAQLRGEPTVAVGSHSVPLEQLLLAPSGFTIDAEVVQQLETLRFISSVYDAVTGELSDLPMVQDFLSGLESTTTAELGGLYRATDGGSEAQWSARLHSHGIGDGTIAGVNPMTVEEKYHRDGRGRALGLLSFLSRVYASTAEILEAKVFQSHRALCDYLLRPFPWLRRAIEKLAVEHGLADIPALAGLFPAPSAAEPEPEVSDAPSSTGTAVGSDYKSCLDRQYVQLEVREAKGAKKPIITVFEEERRRQAFFDYSAAWKKYGSTEWEWVLNIDSVTYRRDKHEAQAMLARIVEKMVGPACRRSASQLNAPGHWDIFLSHAQAAAGDQVKTLYFLLKERGYTVWYDNEMSNRSTAAMEEGVRHSSNFLLFLSGDPELVSGSSNSDPTPVEEGIPPGAAPASCGPFSRLACCRARPSQLAPVD